MAPIDVTDTERHIRAGVLHGVARSLDFRWTSADWAQDESPDLLDFSLTTFAGGPLWTTRD
jgi:hypothetical protein